jgi:hypothetical protein
MIPPDRVLVMDYAPNSYTAKPVGEVYDAGPDRVVVSRLPGVIIITIRGTANPAGWWSDFEIAPKVTRTHPQIGGCEDGFLTGAEALYALIRDKVATDPQVLIVIVGHSRGAEIAPILAGLFVTDGIQVARVVSIEKPWGNGPVLRKLLHDAGVTGVEFWHGDDPVPLAPALPQYVLCNFPIIHFGAWSLNPIGCHMLDGIVAAFGQNAALGATDTSITTRSSP